MVVGIFFLELLAPKATPTWFYFFLAAHEPAPQDASWGTAIFSGTGFDFGARFAGAVPDIELAVAPAMGSAAAELDERFMSFVALSFVLAPHDALCSLSVVAAFAPQLAWPFAPHEASEFPEASPCETSAAVGVVELGVVGIV
jgi:hypothetical protein